ncbi:MAG: branched-chain amino acid transporter permease [Oscillospiraceae bacterium]|nr:branched-chain amino acid transporter permease [Oscillospiraceae bacterium]
MTGLQYAAIIGAVAVGTMLTRFLPFLAFGREKPAPKYVQYLGKALPGAALGLLVIYCVRSVDVTAGNHGIPMFAAMLITTGLHIWRRNMLLSIAVGTAAYILLINFAF